MTKTQRSHPIFSDSECLRRGESNNFFPRPFSPRSFFLNGLRFLSQVSFWVQLNSHHIPNTRSLSNGLVVYNSSCFTHSLFFSHTDTVHGFMVACNNGMECCVSEYISNTDNLLNQNAYYKLFIFSLYLVQVLVSFINEYNEVVGALEK